MEALPKQPQGVAIDVDGGEQGNQTGNEEQEDSRCSLSSTVTIKERGPSSMSGTSSSSSSSSLEVDLETGVAETQPQLAKDMETDCRICHLTLDPTNLESGLPIELGCSCKDDLAAAHKHCAEAWFKIKGNRTCEICGSTALNVVAAATETNSTELWNEANDSTAAAAAAMAPITVHAAETRNFWQGHRFLNFLLACMVFAFVISWLFHFNVPS